MRRRSWELRATYGAVLTCVFLAGRLAAADSATPFDGVALVDPRGKPFSPLSFEGRPTVVVFVGVECPLVRMYMPALAELHREFHSRGVEFLAVDSNVQDSPAELESFRKEIRPPFQLVKDSGARLADALGAQRTPEAVLLDQQGRVRYRGRIDDQFGVGYQRPKVGRRDLASAIDDLLAGRPASRSTAPAVGCRIGRARPASPNPTVTWSGQIAGIIQQRCQSCHRAGDVGPFSLESYSEAAGWAAMIDEVVGELRMPPWHADPAYGCWSNDPRLTDAERSTIHAWVEQGAPEGDPAQTPPPRQFPVGWRIGKPDLVVPIADRPFSVPAEGQVEYQWFFVDPGFREDRWVQASELRPGAKAVVHHATVYLKPPGRDWDLRLNDRIDLIGGFNPGGGPWRAPGGMAMRIPAGSQIVFEMHYTPNGTAQQDRSELGLIFADVAVVKRQVHCAMPANTTFVVPPFVDDFQVEAGFVVPADAQILFFRPHMHLRGKSFRYEVATPDGARRVLLSVPKYDFNWQHSYVPAEPLHLPGGAEIRCVAHFDNSKENPSNPDPSAAVRWGDQSSQEMMIGILGLAFDQAETSPPPSDSPPPRSPFAVLSLVGLLAAAACLTAVLVGRSKVAAALVFWTAIGSISQAQTSPLKARIGDVVEGVFLKDVYGKEYSFGTSAISRGADETGVCVVAFLGVECPLCRVYGRRLSDLAEKYGKKGVRLLGVYSNQQDSITEVRRFAQSLDLRFPQLMDPGNIVADRLAAARTPEVVVIDRNNRIRYRGRIDDQYAVGIERPQARRRDLQDALDELLDGKEVQRAETTAAGCLIGRAKPAGRDGPVRWTQQISRIFQQRCQQCHRSGQIAPFSLLEYEEASGWAEMIGEVVREGRMPPWHANPDYGKFSNDGSMTPEEKKLVLDWVADGAPFGKKGEEPPPRAFSQDWQIPQPDEIVYMAREPFVVPAQGVIDYQYFTVDPGWKEGRWVSAVECRAGNRAVVHHMAVFIQPPDASWIDAFKHFLSGNAQGWGRMRFPKGTARYVPAGSRFVFVMHYSPAGVEMEDRSYMGLVFADPREVTTRCWTAVAVADDFEIPPRTSDYKVQASYRFDRDASILSLFPHMHLRGKSFRYTARYPDGREEILLDVPRYDFGWQENFELAAPKPMPKGTRIECTAVYDNSEDNPQNPDPDATVRWGFQSSDEMLDGHMQLAGPISDPDPENLVASSIDRRWGAAALVGVLAAVGFLSVLAWVRRVFVRPAPPAHAFGQGLLFYLLTLGPATAAIGALHWAPAAPAGWKTLGALVEPAAWGWILAILTGALLEPVRRAAEHFGGRLALAAAAGAFALFLADGLGERIYPRPAFHLRARNALFEQSPKADQFAGLSSTARYTTNSLGVRGPEMPAEDSVPKILCLGGSTTECLYVDDAAAWPTLLAAEVSKVRGEPVWTGAAAVVGAGTAQHLRFLHDSPIVDRVDAILCVVGGEDLLRSLYQQGNEESRSMVRESWLVDSAREAWNSRLRRARILVDPTGEFYQHQRRFLEIDPPAAPIDWDRETAEYETRLRAMIVEAAQKKKQLVFCTQPTLWSKGLSTGAKRKLLVARVFPAGREWDLATAERLRPILESYNNVTRRVCESTWTTCVDLGAMSGREEFFWDDLNFSDAGCREAAVQIARGLAGRSPGKPPGDGLKSK